MPKMVRPTKKKDADNTSLTEMEHQKNSKTCELSIFGEEKISQDDGCYILALCGTHQG